MKLRLYIVLIAVFALSSVFFVSTTAANCASPANEIVEENCLPGTPQGQWDISGIGDPTIQGFATAISVNQGETIDFKITTPATNYRIDICLWHLHRKARP
jgi:hypothetical protein